MLNNKELVFIPTGGVRGMGPVTKLVSSRDNQLPYVLLDSDKPGKDYLKQIKNGTYRDQQDKVLDVATFLGDKAFEIEDLIPAKTLAVIIDRMYRGKAYFEDVFNDGEPIVDQIEKWASDNALVLGLGWKVDVARELLNNFDRVTRNVPEETVKHWVALFNTFSIE